MSTTSLYAAEAAAEPVPHSSLPSRIVKLFVSPGELFEEFREHAPWGGALGITLAISIIASAAIFFLVPTETFAELIRNDILSKGGQLPPEEMMAKIVPQAKLFGLIAAVFGPFVSALIVATVLLVVCRFAMGGKSAFNQYLAVTTHVQVLLAVGGALVAPLIFMKRDPSVNLSLTLLFSDLTPKSPVFGLLHSLDVFHVWALALIAIGVSKIDGRRSWVPSAVVLTLVYLVVTVGVPMLLGMVMPKPGGA
jgi:hypothetical protein